MIYNIKDNIHGRWCIANMINTEHVPFIELIEFHQTTSMMDQAMRYWADFNVKAQKGAAAKGSIYKNLYIAEPTKNIYILPYLNEYHHQINQSWSALAGIGYDNWGLLKYRLQLEQFKSVAAGVEQPHAWSGQKLAEFQFTIPLINTFKPDEDIIKNFKFIRKLTEQTLLGRPDALRYNPPCIYEMHIPGIRYSPACVINTLRIKNKGAIHYHKLNGKSYNIPDIWELVFSIKELILESRETFKQAIEGDFNKVQAIGPTDDGVRDTSVTQQ